MVNKHKTIKSTQNTTRKPSGQHDNFNIFFFKEGYHDARYGLSGTIALIGLIELVISIVSATFTCAACSGQSAQQVFLVIVFTIKYSIVLSFL